MDDVSQLLVAANAGDRASTDRVFALVYADLKRLAQRQVAGAGAVHGATSLVHEAWLRMAQAKAVQANDRAHFFALAAQVMRQLVVDRARSLTAAKRGGGQVAEDYEQLAECLGSSAEAERVLELDQALQRLAALDRHLVQLVEMRFFAGLELEEIAPLTGRSERSLRRDWRRADDSTEEALTGTGMRLYSPAYAAPEQIRGQSVGTATDVFSLGVVLHELLTGRLPYPARSASADRLIASLADETAPRASHALRSRTPEGIGMRELQGDLDTIIATALQPDPARRYVGAAQLADDLRRWLEGRPVAARPDTAGYRFSRFVGRHRLAAGSVVAVLLSLLAGLGVALWQADVAREEARRAERTWGFVRALFDDLSPTRARGEMSVDALLREGLARMDGELSDVPDIHAALRGTFAKALTALGHSDESVPHLERVVQEQEALAGRGDALANTLGNLSIAYKAASRLPEAEAAARRALALHESLPGDQRAHALAPRTVLANILTTQRRGEEAIVQHERILADRRSLPDIKPIDLAVDYNNLAAAYLATDRYAEAQRRYDELDQLLISDPAAPPSRRVYSLAGLAFSLYGLGRYDEALATVEEMRAVGEATLGADHPMVRGGSSGLRARIAQAQGDLGRADALFADAVAHLDARNIGPVELSWSFNHIRQGRDADAMALLQSAIAHLDVTQGPASTHALLARSALATLQARRDLAVLAAAEAAFGRFDETGQTRNDELPRAALLLADVLEGAGRSDDARALRQRAVTVLGELFDASHPVLMQARATLE